MLKVLVIYHFLKLRYRLEIKCLFHLKEKGMVTLFITNTQDPTVIDTQMKTL